MLLAASDDEPAEATEARIEFAGARLVRVVAVAAVVVFVGGSLEHVMGPLECCELGAPVLELHAELSNSRSCGGASVIHTISLSAIASVRAMAAVYAAGLDPGRSSRSKKSHSDIVTTE